ncbi:MAG: hypothetical protein V4527_14650 [Pseudomonadota bacterium]
MILDLRPGTPLDPWVAARLTSMAPEISHQFHLFLEQVAILNPLQDQDWLLRAISRNTLFNGLYERLGRLALLRALIDDGLAPTTVVVDSLALRTTIESGLRPQQRSFTVKVNKAPTRSLIGAVGQSLAYLAIRFCCSRSVTPAAPQARLHALTVLDVFVISSSFGTDGQYDDRYWGSLWNSMTPDEKASAAYLPTLVGQRRIADFLMTFRAMRASSRRFLLREDVLRLSDYFAALWTAVRVPIKDWKTPPYLGFDVEDLFRMEALSERGGTDLVNAALTIRHFARLKEKGVTLRLVLDWFEGQPGDRALAIAVRRYFPDTSLLAYCGAIMPEEELSIRPASYELKAGTIPSIFVVTGSGFVSRTQFYAPNVIVEIGPAMRYAALWTARKKSPDPSYFTLLALLPLDVHAARGMVAMLRGMPRRHNLRIWLKRHPVHRATEFDCIDAEGMTFIDASFDAALEESDAVLSSASVTSLEALLRGIPAIIAANLDGFTRNPIPAPLRHAAAIATTGEELAAMLNQLPDKKELSMLGERYRAVYFIPATRQAMRNLLRLS